MGKRAKTSAFFVETPAVPGLSAQMRSPNDSPPLLAELSEQMRAQGSLLPALAGMPEQMQSQKENIDGLYERIPAGNRDVLQQVEKLLEGVNAKSHEQIEKTTKIAETLSRSLKRLPIPIYHFLEATPNYHSLRTDSPPVQTRQTPRQSACAD